MESNKRGISRLGKIYLILYNSGMFVAFLNSTVLILKRELTGTLDKGSLTGAASVIKLLTYTQLLEVLHPILGLVPGGPLLPFMQITGRMIVNSFIANPVILDNSAVAVKYLFLVWSTIELFRYSYYTLRLLDTDVHPITWGRYSLFLPLYPLGGFCESQVLLTAAKHLDSTGGLSLSLPNPANVSFHAPSVLRFYVYGLLGPSILHLMRYMWSQRKRQLKPKVA